MANEREEISPGPYLILGQQVNKSDFCALYLQTSIALGVLLNATKEVIYLMFFILLNK